MSADDRREGVTPRSNEMLGRRVRRLRREAGWTLAELAERTRLATSTLSKVENNLLSLTYNNLTKLAQGLGIDIAQLFTDEIVSPNATNVAVVQRGGGLFQTTPNFGHEYLFEGLFHKRMVPIVTEVRSQTLDEFGEWDRHEGEEFIYVLEGTIEVFVGRSEPQRLRAGDSCYFDASFPHAALSVGRSPACILSVTSRPEESAVGLRGI